jgi:hypothetical protein
MNNDKGQEEWARRGGERVYVGKVWYVFYEGCAWGLGEL